MSNRIVPRALGLLAVTFFAAVTGPSHGALTIMRSLTGSMQSGAYPIGKLALKTGDLYGFTYYGTIGSTGGFFKLSAAGVHTNIVDLPGSPGPASPRSGPVLNPADGFFYATSYGGGSTGTGCVFKISTAGAITVIHDFVGGAADGANPNGALILASDGKLYGTTLYGGTTDSGTIWRINTNGSGFTILKSFNSAADAYYPYMALCEGNDGKLYGTSYYHATDQGCVYRINRDGTGYIVVTTFASGDPRGSRPLSDLVKANNGKLYGACGADGESGLGTVFSVDTTTNTVALVHAFTGMEGATPVMDSYPYPQCRLVPGPSGSIWNDNIWGTTRHGGAYGFGTIYNIGTRTNEVFVSANLTETAAKDMTNAMTYRGQSLWGTSYHGGATSIGGDGNDPPGYGSAFSCIPGWSFTLWHSFYQADIYQPYDSPTVPAGGYCYGTAYVGGTFGAGAVYKISISSPFPSLVYSFNPGNWEGGNPMGGLIKGADGLYYGCTTAAGRYGAGTAFKIRGDGKLTTLHHFRGQREGALAHRKLTQGTGTDTTIYGVSYELGSGGYGSIWKMMPDGTNFRIIRYFSNLDGRYPSCQLTPEHDTGTGRTKYLYGCTYAGGVNGLGTLFRINPTTGAFTVLHSFTGGNGPYFGGPMVLRDGILYGTTYSAGVNGHGSIFSYNTVTNTFTTLYSMDNAAGDGYQPSGGVAIDVVGNLFGTNFAGGVSGFGTLWRFNIADAEFTLLHSFGGMALSGDGAGPFGGVVYDPASATLFGTTYMGGSADNGTIFKSTVVP